MPRHKHRKQGRDMVVMSICHGDDTNPSGGLEQQAFLLARRLRAQGENVVMLSSTRIFSRRGWTTQHGVPVRFFWTYHSPQISGRYLPAALIWALQCLCWALWHRRAIRVFHAHQLRIHSFVGAWLHRYCGIAHIGKSATGGAGADIRAIGSRKYFGDAGRRMLIRHTDRFIATTASIAQDLRLYGVSDTKISVIPNGLDIQETPAPADPHHRYRRAMFLGRLSRDKNIVPLAQAMMHYVHTTPASALTLDYYGTGEQHAALAQLVDHHASITVAGFTDNPAMIMGRYGVLLLPSDAEGLSNAMLEAMCYGLVPVVTRVSGCIDHISHGENGLFLDGTDQNSLLQGLALVDQLSITDWQRISDNARHYARTHFAMDDIAQRYRALYQELYIKT